MIDKSNFFGICEVFEGATDAGTKPEQTVELAAALGCKSMRLWMHHTDLMRLNAKGEPVFLPQKLKMYKDAVARLTGAGIRHLTGMNHNYLYPPAFTAEYGNVPFNVIPFPNGEHYAPFLRLLETASEMLAREFPDVKNWEPGNEVNLDRFIAKPGYPEKDAPPEGRGSAAITYTDDEKAGIAVDLTFYAARGIRRANPAARIALPSPAGGPECTAGFIDLVYRKIESGAFPRHGAPERSPRAYFDVLTYHPYNFDGQFWRLEEEFYNRVQSVAAAHGNADIPVFITEYGYYDDDLVKFGLNPRESDIRQAAYLVGDFDALKKLKCVETVHYFRLYDWLEGPGMEKTFGLFTSPAHGAGIVPKAKGLALYKYFKGADADIRPLYRFARIDVQGDQKFLNGK
ncbi:hypothetical protein FACS1894211_06120 [Clostridia bacterium]|nr:hypothetical protein FACS1894211_06120 [Clostridia bacterium]